MQTKELDKWLLNNADYTQEDRELIIEALAKFESSYIHYAFFVETGDGEVATIEAHDLDEAKEKFAEMHPDDIDKIKTITSEENGYEEIL